MVIVKSFEKDGRKFPTIELKNGDTKEFGFTFGVTKARLILENFDEIRQFVEDNSVAAN